MRTTFAVTFKQFIWSCFSIPAYAFFHSVDDLRRTLCITMGLSITFSLTKWYANFCKMLFLKSLGFAESLRAGGCPLTALACLRSSSKASWRRQNVLTEDALFNGYAVVGWALTYPKQKVLLSIFFFSLVHDKGKSRAKKGWWQGGKKAFLCISHIYYVGLIILSPFGEIASCGFVAEMCYWCGSALG